jgi:fructose-bisphosphate aldolase class 1
LTPASLETTARLLLERGKGILAADESLATIKQRFDKVGLASTEECHLMTSPQMIEVGRLNVVHIDRSSGRWTR